MLDFSVYHDPTCNKDRLLYYDGPNITTIEPLIYCGYYVSRLPINSGNIVNLEFFSNERDSSRGFKITYEAVNGSSTEIVQHTREIGEYCR